jgi:hypothetical protein
VKPAVCLVSIVLGCATAACGGGSSKPSASPAAATSNAASSTTVATTTTVPRQSSITTNCGLFTAAQLQQAFGVALKPGTETSVGCDYSLVRGAGQVTVSFAGATSVDPTYGATFYRAISRGGEPINVPGAAEATYTSNTNPFGQVSEEIVVLTKQGASFSIDVAGDDAPKGVRAQLVTAAKAGVARVQS